MPRILSERSQSTRAPSTEQVHEDPARTTTEESSDVPGRLGHLVLAAEAVRRKRTERDIRKILQFFGMLSMALGFLSIGLGWYGASHSGYQYEEIPFLISGGIFGLGLIIAGGALIRGAWSLREIEEARRNADQAHRDALILATALKDLLTAAESEGRAPDVRAQG
jgi:hypothetical protein